MIQGDANSDSERTKRCRRDLLDKLLWFADHRGYEAVGRDEILDFLIHVRRGHLEPGGRWGGAIGAHPCPSASRECTPSTVATYDAHLRAFFAWASRQRYIPISPMLYLDKVKVPKNQIRPLFDDQVEALIAAARRSIDPVRDRALIILLFDTGLRRAEAAALTLADVDWRHKQIRIVAGKGDKLRYVAFGSAAAAALWEQAARYDDCAADSPLFRAKKGTTPRSALTPDGIYRIVRRLGVAAAIKDVRCSPHTLRHTMARSYVENGGAQMSLMNQLGHESPVMTSRYVNLFGADLQRNHAAASPADNLKRRSKK